VVNPIKLCLVFHVKQMLTCRPAGKLHTKIIFTWNLWYLFQITDFIDICLRRETYRRGAGMAQSV
jgi:hypothetical protein